MNDEMRELLKVMRMHPGNEPIKRTVAILAEIVDEQEERIKALEALVPPMRVVDPRNPLGVEIVLL